MKLDKLKTKYLARNTVYHDKLESTQTEAKKLAKQKVKNGTIVITKNQTSGKGTHGRVWESNPRRKCNFYFNFVSRM